VYLFVNYFWKSLLWLWLKCKVEAQPYYFWQTHVYHIKTITPRPLYQLLPKMRICSTCYTVEKINRQFPLWMEAIMCLPQNQHFLWWAKKNGTQRRALVCPWRMHCMYSGIYIYIWQRHLLGWSDVEQRKYQAFSLSHCRVMLDWKHQAVG